MNAADADEERGCTRATFPYICHFWLGTAVQDCMKLQIISVTQ